MKFNRAEQRQIMELMNDSLYARSKDDVSKLLQSLQTLIPYNAISLTRKNHDTGAFSLQQSIIGSYPEKWAQLYYRKNYASIDPVISLVNQSSQAITWKSAFCNITLNSEIKEFIEKAREYGLRNGIAYLIPGNNKQQMDSLLSMETGELKLNSQQLQLTEYILPHIHESLNRVYREHSHAVELPEFSQREKETLKWAYEGKTAWEIGIILSISERTVKFHLNNIYRKLNVSNRSQAIALSIQHGII